MPVPLVKPQERDTSEVHHLVGAAEIGVMLGISRQRVQQLADKPGFPAPTVVLSMGKVWHADDVRRWAETTGRVAPDP